MRARGSTPPPRVALAPATRSTPTSLRSPGHVSLVPKLPPPPQALIVAIFTLYTTKAYQILWIGGLSMVVQIAVVVKMEVRAAARGAGPAAV